MSKIYDTWCERIDAPVMEASHIRQFKDAIALPVLTGERPGGKRTAPSSGGTTPPTSRSFPEGVAA